MNRMRNCYLSVMLSLFIQVGGVETAYTSYPYTSHTVLFNFFLVITGGFIVKR